jgi:hypothetical protein
MKRAKYRKVAFACAFGFSIRWLVERQFNGSAEVGFRIAEHMHVMSETPKTLPATQSSQSTGNNSHQAFIVVKHPSLVENVKYGNKTAFELLQEKNNCSAAIQRPACGPDCVRTSTIRTLYGRKRWCKVHCKGLPCCLHFICLLGNPLPLPPVSELYVYPPPMSDAHRLIPRIIHQTWNEQLTKEKYPNWSVFHQSFQQQDGYDYRFYTDDEARKLIQSHFPDEVVRAYDDLLPGAYKADLFRYCALLIYGGVYADVDILMVSKLDDLITNNTGFVVPLDTHQPFNRTLDGQSISICLWNGFMAASPGHPYLAKVIENVVNGIRNRYNEVDHAHMASCPMQVGPTEMHRSATLYATGPCMLGLTVNQVLGRHEQSSFELGEFDYSHNGIPGSTKFLDAVGRRVS